MAIKAEDLLQNVQFERPSLLDSLARLADPLGIDEAHDLAGVGADAKALARDMEIVGNDLRAAFDKMRAEVDEPR